MNTTPEVAGLAALAICESILLSLAENQIIGDAEARAILEDAAAAHRNAVSLTADGTTWSGRRMDGARETTGVSGPLVDGGLCLAPGAVHRGSLHTQTFCRLW